MSNLELDQSDDPNVTFYVVRTKKHYCSHGDPSGPIDVINRSFDFDKGWYLTLTKFAPSFATARIFPTVGKAKANIRQNSWIPGFPDWTDWFEILPVEVKEPD